MKDFGFNGPALRPLAGCVTLNKEINVQTETDSNAR